ncbi:unnamed protein product [Medioppia subpectinata]|uniref:RNA helicase n=1 Tax=Medioppia subpectinata TaxID=1979941 RepID=A0A7R9PW06_9ACAR|nr:unnamed protein product [Medioppia subpectinata]CAG2102815.1 unnamed protein product [Medioppia subpectinata]
MDSDLKIDFELLDYEDDEEEFNNEQLLNGNDYNLLKSPEKITENRQNTSFRDFLLKPELLRAITDCGFENPSEVQTECIPQAVLGVDILCQAKSGMGKTCVFVLSTLQQLDTKSNSIEVVVLVHTRELAFQVSREYDRFSKYMNVETALLIGGIPQRMDERCLRVNRPNIVVATAGRLIALIRDKTIDLTRVQHFVIDEFDKMLSERDTIQQILFINQSIPTERQIMMFSATMDENLHIKARKLMQNPLEVIIGDDRRLILHGLQQFYVEILEKEKLKKLCQILANVEYKQTIIFVNTIQRCKALYESLYSMNMSVVPIHSSLSQEMRLNNYQLVKSYRRRILVVTIMFDRGIDFDRVNLVVNYDMPECSDDYLHAVGRAGRFGTKGIAISFISGYMADKIRNEIQSRFDIKLDELPENVVI